MTTLVNGNYIQFTIDADDIGKSINYTLPDGYSVNQLYYSGSNSISLNCNKIYLSPNVIFTFPIVSSKSPNVFRLYVGANAKVNDSLRLIIIKFGCIPDSHYFDKAF